MTEARHPNSKAAIGIGLLVLVLSAPLMHRMGEQQASRIAFTAAVWDHHTFEIDRYESILGRDRAVVNGVMYSDKAPAQPLLMVPFYAIYRLLGGEPAEEMERRGELGLWWLTVWTSAVPAAALAVLMFRWAAETHPETAVPAAVSVVLGTLILPYAALLFAHVLTSLLAFLSFLLVRRVGSSIAALAAGGSLAGLAVAVEYPTVLIVGVVFVVALVAHRAKALIFLVAGLPFVAILAFYNQQLFGGLLTFPYQWSAWTAVRSSPANLTTTALQDPALRVVMDALFDGRGLFIATPIVLMGLVGAAMLWRAGDRIASGVALSCFVAMLVLVSTRGNPWAGGPGARYVIPALPFLALPIAHAWSRLRRLTLLASAMSVMTMVAVTWTEPQVGPELQANLGHWLRLVLAGLFADTVPTMLWGPLGWVINSSLAAAAVWYLISVARKRGTAEVAATARSPGGRKVGDS